MRAFAELSESGKRIAVYFPYTVEAKDAVKSIPGARFVDRDKAKDGRPHWELPLDLISAKLLRERFGRGLELGDEIKEWGRTEVAKGRKLNAIVAADDVPIEELVVGLKLPELAQWFRPYQRADVSILGTTSILNLNEPRLGKTTETIAAVYEAGLENGPQLIIAPQKSLDTVWRMEIERWTGDRVYVLSGETPKDERVMPDEVPEDNFWYITTADMLRRQQDRFMKVRWNTFTIDEYHKTGLLTASGVNDPKKNSQLVLATRKIDAQRRFALSGTPIGGKPIKLWSGLNFIAPDVFTSKWRWAETWLEVETDDHGYKSIGGIRKDKQDQFYGAHAKYIVRRLREEVLPQLPPKQNIPVWCDMPAKQRKQYDTFADDLEVRIDDHRVAATNVLTEYTRLKQFAGAYCGVRVVGQDEEGNHEIEVWPEGPSGKLPYLVERLIEVGIDPEDPQGQAQAIVASQSIRFAEWYASELEGIGIKCVLLTGKTSKKQSELAQRVFKADNDNEGYRVCVMVTTMGVGITMDNVESVHLMDETWNPDDQEQLTDRAVNTTRNHQVNVFTYRSKGTVEEYIYSVNATKEVTNRDMLDYRRVAFKQRQKGGVK